MLVWMAAYDVYPDRCFLDYAILGDDIVIADEKVALSYQRIMGKAMAVISQEKSLISHRGACEFAKRFLVECAFSCVHLMYKDVQRICGSFRLSTVGSEEYSELLPVERRRIPCILPF